MSRWLVYGMFVLCPLLGAELAGCLWLYGVPPVWDLMAGCTAFLGSSVGATHVWIRYRTRPATRTPRSKRHITFTPPRDPA